MVHTERLWKSKKPPRSFSERPIYLMVQNASKCFLIRFTRSSAINHVDPPEHGNKMVSWRNVSEEGINTREEAQQVKRIGESEIF